MILNAVKTHKITNKDTDIFKILDTYLPKLSENSIIVVTSKIVSLCEGNIIPMEKADKDESLIVPQGHLLAAP